MRMAVIPLAGTHDDSWAIQIKTKLKHLCKLKEL